MVVILFIVVLAILIFVHELGHFLAARACGIRVDEFALGFGPKLWKKKYGETVYAINAVPFGGYVKIFGENPDDESIKGPDSRRSFVHKPKWQQVIVLAAGVLFNFIFAWLVICLAFSVGTLASRESYPQYADRMTDSHIAITYVDPSSPAQTAGFKAGETITGFSKIDEVRNAINESKDQGIIINGRKVIAKEGIVEGKYAIGINMENVATLQLPPHLAIYEGSRLTIHFMKQIAVGLWDLVFGGKARLSDVSGPIGIAGYIHDAAQLGFTYLMTFTAIISINLGVLNLVPFPALDGGRILFVIIEAVVRRPIKPKIANTVNAVGFSFLILLMIVVTYRDILKLFVK